MKAERKRARPGTSTAFHEAGHAVAAYFSARPIKTATVVRTARALGQRFVSGAGIPPVGWRAVLSGLVPAIGWSAP